jgi:hypothetical protein
VYLLTATITIYNTTTSNPPAGFEFKLWDANATAYVPGGIVSQHLIQDELTVITISTLYTSGGANHTLQLYGSFSGTEGDGWVAASDANFTTMVNYIRLS